VSDSPDMMTSRDPGLARSIAPQRPRLPSGIRAAIRRAAQLIGPPLLFSGRPDSCQDRPRPVIRLGGRPSHRSASIGDGHETTTAIAHLREVLGDQTYESLARAGEKMTTAAMATYAYDQIDQARTELEHPS
jgi:hypothetical protein